MNAIFIFIGFAVIGAGLKYIDIVFDEGELNKKIAIMIAPLITIISICLSFYDAISATILFSILFAVLLSGKIDNLVFLLSSSSFIAITTFMIHFSWINILLLPLIILVAMGIVDEKGNDYVDTHNITKTWKFLFMYRFCMKIGMFILCLFSIFQWVYLIAFLVFDASYEIVGYYGEKAKMYNPNY